jgi:16S rRNA (adenine1518-N6/adenine1519-N6)-dimethyltransferase
MASPKRLLSMHAVRPSRRLSQNFLADPQTARMIVRRARVMPEERVLEIGAGLGALTLPLAQAARHVWAVEKDPRLGRLLQTELQSAGITNVTLIEADILRLSLAPLAAEAGGRLTVFGNLPYGIASQIVVALIENRRLLSRAVLMFQKELAVRLAARPGSRDYGRITAMLAACGAVRPLADVKAGRFFPPPRVDSAVLEITFPADRGPLPDDEAALFRLVAAAFGKRRKTLKNALAASALLLSAGQADAALREAGIDPQRRAETVSPEEFMTLERCVRRIREAERDNRLDPPSAFR